MISTADLQAMQALVLASLPDTAQVLRRTLTSDGMGGSTETWATVATVACLLSPYTSRRDPESLIAGRLVGQQQWTVILPSGTDVQAKDRLQIGTRTFEVSSVEGPRSYEVSRRVWCVEVL